MSVHTTTHFIARGVCVRGDTILLAHHIEADYDFLPGGHVEPCESMQSALERECDEEFGAAAHAGDLITIFEHCWENKGETQHEINGIFALTFDGENGTPVSKVPHLSFNWVPISEIGERRFLPSELLMALKEYLAGNSIPRLISTIR